MHYLSANPSASPSVFFAPPSSSTAAAAARAPIMSSLSCPHHLFPTHVPGINTVYSQRSRIGCVVMYCATILSLLSTYASNSSNLASCKTVSKGEYWQPPSSSYQRCLPVIYLDTLCLTPPVPRPMRGFIIHVSDPKMSTSCTTALKNTPDTLGLSPSLNKIIDNRAQIFLTFHRLPATTGQSSSNYIIIWHSYLKYVTEFSGLPQAWESLSVLALNGRHTTAAQCAKRAERKLCRLAAEYMRE